MLSTKNYDQMSPEDLQSELQKMKSQKIPMAVFIGFLVGVAIYAATHKGFLLTMVMLVLAYSISHRQSVNSKRLQDAIDRRDKG